MAVQNQRSQQQQQQPQTDKQHRAKTSTITAAKVPTARASKTKATAIATATATASATITTPKTTTMPSNTAATTTTTTTQMAPTTAGTSTGAGAAGAAGNGGPRVSFNRDVHVKRIGKHPNEITNYETTNLHPPQNTVPYHQLPADFSAESIRKEAALVLAQAERHKSKAENGDNIPTFKVRTKRSGDPKKFHSLPTRKKKAPAKPVTRSVSDAAAKKPAKRPSIFSIFSRKSDSNVNQVERDPRFEDSGGRRLVRSKSDVGSDTKDERKLKKALKEAKPSATPAATTNSGDSKPFSTPLSPIIEHAQKEDYFAEQFNRERRKSDAITDREKHESGLGELLERSRSQAELDGAIVGKNPISHSIRDKILTLQSQSHDNMHSSQLPAQKLPLTKGVTVNGLAKRLSMERFSPPPPLSGPAFSYIRPNEGITYAQLDLSDDQQQRRREQLRSPARDIRTPMREYRSPARDVRDMRSPERELRPVMAVGRHAAERADFVTSQNNLKNSYTANYSNLNGNSHGHGASSRVIIEPTMRERDSFSPTVGPTTIRISSSHSPSPWQQLSPRNLSDEDEGLGIETRKYYDDELVMKPRSSKSPAEPPIVPVIRSVTPPLPRENGHATRAYRSPARDEPADDIGYRRARLESRILTRRFGETAIGERNGYQAPPPPHVSGSPERYREVHEETANGHQRYLSPEREMSYEPRFHKPETTEILNKYSPERSHLDIIAPSAQKGTTEKTSRYKHTKYYDDGRGGVKEVYERETHLDAQGKPHVRESRHRERLDGSLERPPLNDYEPKSLDSQFTSTDQYRSSPENMKRYELNGERQLGAPYPEKQRMSSDDNWHSSSLKRDKLQQRSFDKGDSGIENDFRKESFNGELTSRWRKRTIADDIKTCESFLKKERRHTEQQQVMRRKDQYVYRERSIDDGSHFDPHLDKYPVATNTLRRKDQHSQTPGQDTLKRNKKLGGFEKVKQLFTGSGGGGGGGGSGGSTGSNEKKKEAERHGRANSSTTTTTTTSSSAQTQTPTHSALPPAKEKGDKAKQRYMVKEEEMRSRYSEHRVADEATREPKATDISMRRRLSTPKASPLLLKRTSSDKPKKESPLAKPEKTSWFKSLDRRSKSKSKEKLNVSVNGQNEASTMKRSKTARNPTAPPIPPKNLRFFGDTDLDSNPPTISRASNTLKSRPALSSSTLNRSQKYSQSAYNLDRINPPQSDYRRHLSNAQTVGATRHKSSSMHNLENGSGGGGVVGDEVDFRKRRHYSRSRDLDDISESGSETEDQHKRPNGGVASARTLSRERLDRDRSHRYDENTYRRSNDRAAPLMASTPNGGVTASSGGEMRRTQQHLLGPPKPARSAERRVMSSYSRERDRFPAESSGTEGESSLHSQRSVVYLHATTVGAIPQPYHLRRRSISRDDLRSNKSKNPPLQPMTRTVSRSVSMLAPWKPKLISEGYEINYSQEQNKRMVTMPRKPNNTNSSSTLARSGKKSDTPTARTRRHEHIKDDQSSLRNSSTTSASKSALSSNLRGADGRRKIK